MKKLIISCAVLLSTAMFMSCDNDPNVPRCWEVTMTVNVMGMPMKTSQYVWCTEAELEAEKQAIKEQQMQAGVSEDFITITSKRTNKSQADCQ